VPYIVGLWLPTVAASQRFTSRAILFCSFPIVLYLVFVRTCVQLFIVLYEAQSLGEQYLEYCQRAPRWIPQLRLAQ
jgi:protein-S-isoprenylcysteine O-methyltransferase Ste14